MMAASCFGRVINMKPPRYGRGHHELTISLGRFSAGLYGVGHEVTFWRKDKKQPEDGISYTMIPVTSKSVEANFHGRACAGFDNPLNPQQVPHNLQPGDMVRITGAGGYPARMESDEWCGAKSPVKLYIGGTRLLHQAGRTGR